MSKFAYVTFIIRNDSFLPGALVFGYALRLQKTKADLICIVSENVSEKAVISLKEIYDDVIVIDELYVPHDRRHERQDRPFLFSRFNAFRLGLDGDLDKQYEKYKRKYTITFNIIYYINNNFHIKKNKN
jgi:hypothetical protein